MPNETQAYENFCGCPCNISRTDLRAKLELITSTLSRLESNKDVALFIPAKDPAALPYYFPNHGWEHIKSVMANINIIWPKIQAGLVEANNCFDGEENLFYLYFAALIHDLAMSQCYKDREFHHKAIKRYLKNILNQNNVLDDSITNKERTIALGIASAHAEEINVFTDYYPWIKHSRYGKEKTQRSVLLPELVIVLRIADGLDITERRTSGYWTDFERRLKDNEINACSIPHWLKHESIIEWELGNNAALELCVSADKWTRFSTENNDITEEQFVTHLATSIEALQKEFIVAKDASKNELEHFWNWDKVVVSSYDDTDVATIDLVAKINKARDSGGLDPGIKIAPNSNQSPPHKAEEPFAGNDATGTGGVDSDLQARNELKDEQEEQPALEKPWIDILSPNEGISFFEYLRSGKDQELLKPGCRKHVIRNEKEKILHSIKVCEWLDTFAFHKDIHLLKVSMAAISKKIKENENDMIVGIGLKGARLASVIGLITQKPILLYKNYKISVPGSVIEDRHKLHRIAIIVDCVITGRTVQNCVRILSEQLCGQANGNPLKIDVYCIFLRVPTDRTTNENVLFSDELKGTVTLYAINDMFTYRKCDLEEDDCPIHKIIGDAIYRKEYKDRDVATTKPGRQ